MEYRRGFVYGNAENLEIPPPPCGFQPPVDAMACPQIPRAVGEGRTLPHKSLIMPPANFPLKLLFINPGGKRLTTRVFIKNINGQNYKFSKTPIVRISSKPVNSISF